MSTPVKLKMPSQLDSLQKVSQSSKKPSSANAIGQIGLVRGAVARGRCRALEMMLLPLVASPATLTLAPLVTSPATLTLAPLVVTSPATLTFDICWR